MKLLRKYYSFLIIFICISIATFTSVSCSQKIVTIDKRVVSEQFKFIHEGSTSQKEILNRLGEPANQYQGGRIFTYLLHENRNYQLNVVTSYIEPGRNIRKAYYNLVLVFGADYVLERYGLVRVR
jgi:hypothetical protein